MKIFAIDDKRSELENAKKAIIENGHELLNMGLGSHRVAEYNGSEERLMNFSSSESTQRSIFKAIERLKNEGGGIITDMMFRLTCPLGSEDSVPPSGLLVVLHALANGVPVVVCTDASEVGGHHAKALHWIHDGYIMIARNNGKLPFGWVEDKNWDTAVKLLEQLHVEKNKKEVIE